MCIKKYLCILLHLKKEQIMIIGQGTHIIQGR